MSKEDIVERIITDAQNEASGIIAEAEKRADAAVKEAELRAERDKAGARADADMRVKAITAGRAASARLDCAKIELAENRWVLEAVYSEALRLLSEMDEKTSLKLAEKLLSQYAEKGDEIVFSKEYKYCDGVKKLEIVKKLGLTVCNNREDIGGGFVLRGKTSDKDTSFRALLEADREQNISDIAVGLFAG